MRNGLRQGSNLISTRRPFSYTACRWRESGIHEDKDVSQARKDAKDPRLGQLIKDDFASFRDSYEPPKHPVVLAHGLLGFDELRLAGAYLPGIQYWRGIREAMIARGITVINATVAPSGSIEERAEDLEASIRAKAAGEKVNIIAHSMGGLDSRYLVSRIKPTAFEVASLTTVSSPHHGSSFADFVFREIGDKRLAKLYKLAEKLNLETGAFRQLTQEYARNDFNPKTPDIEDVRYFSYGAQFDPSLLSAFRFSHGHIIQEEGPNDGLVSVQSAMWGQYKGTLVGVSHLDLINWTNRLKWYASEIFGQKRNFNAVAFYLGVADMLAREGL